MQKANFPFVKKEGKFFAPVVGKQTKKTLVDGVITSRDIPKSGVKGVYSKVRLSLPPADAISRHELFAINTDAILSSQ